MTPELRTPKLVGASPLFHARVAGLTGLLVLASGSFAGFVASRLIVRDDMVASAHNILGSASLYRLGIGASLTMMVAWLFYGLLLYRLLQGVDKGQAMTMLALVLASVPTPRLLGALLMVGSIGYLVLFVQGFLLPGSERTLWTNPFLAITHLSELALLLWLLIRGINVDRWQTKDIQHLA